MRDGLARGPQSLKARGLTAAVVAAAAKGNLQNLLTCPSIVPAALPNGLERKGVLKQADGLDDLERLRGEAVRAGDEPTKGKTPRGGGGGYCPSVDEGSIPGRRAARSCWR